MNSTSNHIISYESRFEIRPDLAIIETFQDGSQLIWRRGYMIIIEACKARISQSKLHPKLNLFSYN